MKLRQRGQIQIHESEAGCAMQTEMTGRLHGLGSVGALGNCASGWGQTPATAASTLQSASAADDGRSLLFLDGPSDYCRRHLKIYCHSGPY